MTNVTGIPTKDVQLMRLVQACETGKIKLEPKKFDRVVNMDGPKLKRYLDEKIGDKPCSDK